MKSLSPEHRAKISSSLTGKKRSMEARLKSSLAQKGRWKLEVPTYNALHWRVREKNGKAKICQSEECEGDCSTFDWASIDGRYASEDDFIQLCRKCHIAHDKKLGSKFGRPRKTYDCIE